jgi:hypothetical protein
MRGELLSRHDFAVPPTHRDLAPCECAAGKSAPAAAWLLPAVEIDIDVTNELSAEHVA